MGVGTTKYFIMNKAANLPEICVLFFYYLFLFPVLLISTAAFQVFTCHRYNILAKDNHSWIK